MIITVDRPDGSPHGGGGPPRWKGCSLTSAPRVLERAGIPLAKMDGYYSGRLADMVRDAIAAILAGPEGFYVVSNYYDVRAVVAELTGLFFTLREIPEGIIRVQS